MADIQSIHENTQALQPEPINLKPSPLESKDSTKRYVFNETGNIMITWVGQETEKFPPPVNELFNEVAEFFVAMLKKISGTINPATKKPYSIYNYNAIMNVINESGLFTHLTGEDITYRSSSFGTDYSKQLIEKLLGLPSAVDGLPFAQSMISSIGNTGLKIGGYSSSSDNTVANIIFICEYLLGMSTVSAVVISCDAKENLQTFQISPCSKETSISTSLTMHKDTYMFAVSNSKAQSTNKKQTK